MITSTSYQDICRIYGSSDPLPLGTEPAVWPFRKDIQLVQENGKLKWQLPGNISLLFFDPQNPNLSSEAENSLNSPSNPSRETILGYEHKIYGAMWEIRRGDNREDPEYGRHAFRSISGRQSSPLERVAAIEHYLESIRKCTVKLGTRDVHLLRPGDDLVAIVVDHQAKNVLLLQPPKDQIESIISVCLERIIRFDENRKMNFLLPEKKWVFNRKIQLLQTQDNLVWRHFDHATKIIRFCGFYLSNKPDFSEAEHGNKNLHPSDLQELTRQEYELYKWTWAWKRGGQDLAPEYGRHTFRHDQNTRTEIIDRYVKESKILEWVVDNKEITIFRSLDGLEVEVIDNKVSGHILHQRQLHDHPGISVEDRISELVFSSVGLDNNHAPIFFSSGKEPGVKWVFSHKAKNLLYKADRSVWRLFDEVTKSISWICFFQNFQQSGLPVLKKPDIVQVYVNKKDQAACNELNREIYSYLQNNYGSKPFVRNLEYYYGESKKATFLESGRKISLMQFGDELEFIVYDKDNRQSTYPVDCQGQDIKNVFRVYRSNYTTLVDNIPTCYPIQEAFGSWSYDSTTVSLVKTPNSLLWRTELDKVVQSSNTNMYDYSLRLRYDYNPSWIVSRTGTAGENFYKNFAIEPAGDGRFSLKNKTFPSSLNPTLQMDWDNWVVTLCSISPKNSSLTSGMGTIIAKIYGHAIIVFEGIKEGNPFCRVAHLTADAGTPQGQARVKIFDWNHDKATYKACKGWQKPRYLVEHMLSKIQDGQLVPFSLIWGATEDVNCLTWSVDTLKLTQLTLPDPKNDSPTKYIKNISNNNNNK